MLVGTATLEQIIYRGTSEPIQYLTNATACSIALSCLALCVEFVTAADIHSRQEEVIVDLNIFTLPGSLRGTQLFCVDQVKTCFLLD